ncbi:hypothetical protein SESBI_39864 [Sesbania bispinosa]|nr:hypothetical protein SESBI_39864 [Sesbania bispinosa]
MKEEMGSEEAETEINAYAFQLHRPPPPCVTEKGNNFNYEIDEFSDVKYCYYLLEAMPLPGPTWSTAGPSVLAEPPSSAAIEASVVGLECGENQSSSYTWWVGFLEGLDGKKTSTEKLNLPFVEDVVNVMENYKGLSHESKFVDAIDLGCCPDDWLVFPTMEKDLGDIVMP